MANIREFQLFTISFLFSGKIKRMKQFWISLPTKEKVKFLLSALAGVLGVIFATLNWNSTGVHLLFAYRNAPLSMIIIFSMLIGYAFGYLPRATRLRNKQRELDKILKELDELKKSS